MSKKLIFGLVSVLLVSFIFVTYFVRFNHEIHVSAIDEKTLSSNDNWIESIRNTAHDRSKMLEIHDVNPKLLEKDGEYKLIMVTFEIDNRNFWSMDNVRFDFEPSEKIKNDIVVFSDEPVMRNIEHRSRGLVSLHLLVKISDQNANTDPKKLIKDSIAIVKWGKSGKKTITL
ncbi:hypothetical protein PAECIP111893_04501 [Paenibacillus plantiphilus]|uniref:DUF4352 domain-containing protein n=1 Tax=Paenibacillus plantiphilus TaxID=2905650 RepID=A0ABN8H059_9BACL|nr:hypothetical protein [Paenibacillus plantiphilus]CAH1219136.1 hypothetical protein PAECIP111893_04501 [Paenibacillus plantiphilus]